MQGRPSLPTAASGSAGPDRRWYRPELDALRFFAFMLVFISHANFRGPWLSVAGNTGVLGVPVFFLLSAFLIVTILLRERDRTGTVRIGAFALRRILRIWPLYFAVLGYGLLHYAFPLGLSRTAVLELSFMLGNLYVLQHGWSALGSLMPLWSLSVEEQFYLVIPLLAKLGGRRFIWASNAATLIVAYAVLAHLGRQGASPGDTVWENSFVQFQFFAAGGFLGMLLFGRTLRLALPLRLVGVALAMLCFFHAVYVNQMRWAAPVTMWNLIAGYLFALLGTCLLLLAVLDLPCRLPRALLYLGKISYGLYLIHFPVLCTLLFVDDRSGALHRYLAGHHRYGVLAALIVTIVLAALSYECLEKPFLRLKRRFETVTTRPV